VVPFQEVFLKQGCESTRQWAFVTFATAEEAVSAQEQTHGVLTFEGSIRPCQVGRGGEEMIGKDQDENGAFKGYTKIIEHSQQLIQKSEYIFPKAGISLLNFLFLQVFRALI